ncbi:MAG: hypothetical protein CHKLHMKO_00527 [Candidatus Argoarchaeum ethanivorans]|uniref:PGF-CTERM archaeal protein-sorting signal domain-containing protein n=1 Tax=Candidatus Argoarchaeum ethanivorans TaxID=2608793 RepID=A0A811TE51_9EURY|nr:MAG: hypothetical protein CHKLHMKO_00527 [Candidatus Argoarchaeum ethanivorans]
MTKRMILAVILLLLPVLVAVAGAQGIPTIGGCEHPSPSIVISASCTEIPADGVSTSEIKVAVSWPEESNITGPAGNTLVDMSTSIGRLTDAENQSNNGHSISLITDTNGIVTALLSGDETGVAYITSTTLWGCDKTTVTVIPGATTASHSGNGNGGNTGSGGVTSTPTTTATPISSPSPDATATATGSPTASPARTPEPTPSLDPTPTEDTPGFEAVFAIAGLLVVAYSVLKRERKV